MRTRHAALSECEATPRSFYRPWCGRSNHNLAGTLPARANAKSDESNAPAQGARAVVKNNCLGDSSTSRTNGRSPSKLSSRSMAQAPMARALRPGLISATTRSSPTPLANPFSQEPDDERFDSHHRRFARLHLRSDCRLRPRPAREDDSRWRRHSSLGEQIRLTLSDGVEPRFSGVTLAMPGGAAMCRSDSRRKAATSAHSSCRSPTPWRPAPTPCTGARFRSIRTIRRNLPVHREAVTTRRVTSAIGKDGA